jgi:phospholipid/cholesterol/gamma-HCH transport system substrate-binding protein
MGRMRGTAVRFGLFAAVTLGLTAFIGAQIAKIQLGDTYQLSAEFDDVSGLTDGDDVKIAGVKVGQVEGIDTTDDGTARVTLSLDEGVSVPDDSEAAVRWRNLLGQRVVYLYPAARTRRWATATRSAAPGRSSTSGPSSTSWAASWAPSTPSSSTS